MCCVGELGTYDGEIAENKLILDGVANIVLCFIIHSPYCILLYVPGSVKSKYRRKQNYNTTNEISEK